MSNKRLKPRDRRAQLLAVALKRARVLGYSNVTREDLATHAGVVPGTVSLTFGTMPNFKRDLMRYAVQAKDLKVIAQGLAAGDPHAKKASDQLKAEALDYLRGML